MLTPTSPTTERWHPTGNPVGRATYIAMRCSRSKGIWAAVVGEGLCATQSGASIGAAATGCTALLTTIASAKAPTAVSAWLRFDFMITPGSNSVGADSRDGARSFSLSSCPVRVDSPFGVFTAGHLGATVECGRRER